MNARVRTAEHVMKAAPKGDKKAMEEKMAEFVDRSELNDPCGPKRSMSWREKKIALQQDVDKLRKKLRHEENVHRALERAFTRPLGALPRLPPYLPSHTLELLAEVAVLEEEVVRLEEQVVNFRQGLYQEAILISSTKKPIENGSETCADNCKISEQHKAHHQSPNSGTSVLRISSPSVRWSSGANPNHYSSIHVSTRKQHPKKLHFSLAEDHDRGKENQSALNSTEIKQESPAKEANWIHSESNEKECVEPSGANKLSEEILRCLLSILSRISFVNNTLELKGETCSSISSTCDASGLVGFRDPFEICVGFRRRDVGPYKNMHEVDACSINPTLITNFPFLTRRLKLLLKKLVSVDISKHTHQQKLAFWINIYNSCMLNAFLENGIPSAPEMVVALMPKARINVGGHLFTAMTIEHCILRLPYHLKHSSPKGVKADEMTRRSMFGLDWPEPLVTFALSCGSWSSPAVRVYTASQVEKQLEEAKRDYLQAAVGISRPDRLAIPKLLDWYLLDFAKDIESLMDWICLQLPSQLRNEAVECIEARRRCAIPRPIQVLPYEFRFRYLLAP
ncbi:hypothetical protein HPP92_016377 [Vanilla planifolia]|uniref:Uncharacterized protein n=1 Tax=Vanilla planifolia TaxID=51239 RepID=A0A835QL32_VANPL|nr:hypothetical protein HPP92_016377 [Vanilla planifolia]